MDQRMREALYQISLCHDPDPDVVCERVVEAVARIYGDTWAMINLVDGDCIRSRKAVNRHPGLVRRAAPLPLKSSLCQFSIGPNCPLLIQNAEADPRFHTHPVNRLHLRRYLGVPICTPIGDAVGTLCFLDDRVEETLGEDDVQFLSLLAMRVSAELERERVIAARVDEQRAQAERMAALNRQLEATAEEKRRFVAMVIHDLRHPLTTLRTVLYLVRREEDEAERAAYLDVLDNRAYALGNLLDELVLYNQIEAGRPLLRLEEADVATLIGDCVAGFAAVPAGTARIGCEISPDLGTVRTDAVKLTHILLNLLANAVKFTPRGTVMVRAHSDGEDRWTLEVEDTGVGMSAEMQARVFEEFVTASSGNSGFGLGLAIVRQLCAALCAEVAVQSVPDVGTCFRVIFPRHPDVLSESASDTVGRKEQAV